MHNLYFTRHGETVWNVENKICGMTDSPLTARGRAQAAALGANVRDSGVHIDEILYSPLSRAADTALAIAEATGIPARPEPRLREQCFGRYEGRPAMGPSSKSPRPTSPTATPAARVCCNWPSASTTYWTSCGPTRARPISLSPTMASPAWCGLTLRYDQRGVCRLRHPELRVRRVYI